MRRSGACRGVRLSEEESGGVGRSAVDCDGVGRNAEINCERQLGTLKMKGDESTKTHNAIDFFYNVIIGHISIILDEHLIYDIISILCSIV